MYSSDFRHPSGQFQVRPIISNESFHYVLETSGMSRNPEYVKAVIRSYIEVKQARGRTGQQIGWKLELLERELPQHAHSFIAVRAEKRLPRSRILADINTPRLARATTHTPNTNTGQSLQEQYILSPSANRLPFRAVSSANIRTARVPGTALATASPASPSTYRNPPQAVNPEDSEELPPPPYASEDPEPEATRDLQVRLAAEAQANGNLNLPEASTRTEHGNENRENGEGNNQSSESNRQEASTPTTVVHAPPPGPPPVHSPPPGPPPASSLQRHESRRSEHQPSTPPTDPEEARIWEESQLEEAMRISRASERERLELEEAMRLSLAESVEPSSNNNFNNDQNNPIFEGNEDQDSGPSSRRVSSYNPASQLEGNHRRAASDTYSRTPIPIENTTSGMDHLTIPDTWQSTSASGSSHGNLMDDDFGTIDFKQPALAPQKTGAVLQSKNPFLSPGERDSESQSSNTFIQPQPSSSSHGQGNEQSSPGMGNSYPIPEGSPSEKRLPTIPGSHAASPTLYEPPPGPPPTSPPSIENKSYLPPLPPRQPTNPIPVESSPNNSSPQSRRLPPRPQGGAPALPQRNISSSMYSATNLPTSSFPAHSPQPSPSFFPPQPQPSPRSASSTAMNQAISNHYDGTNPLETLRDYHTVFMVDDSSSMVGERWAQAREALMGVAETAAQYDDQGVDVYFINSKRVGKELRASADVEDLFAGLEPRGTTPTGLRLEAILREYMIRLERSRMRSPGLEGQGEVVKQLNLIVVTDGVFAHPVIARIRATTVNPSLDRAQLLGIAPLDDPEVVLIACAKRLDNGEFPLSQVGVQFLQIGNDSDAREALQELDDHLADTHRVRDMVDTLPYSGEMTPELIVKTLLGGINRRLDSSRS